MSRQIKRLEPTKKDLVFLYLGILIASIYIILYCTVIAINYNAISNKLMPRIEGPGALGLLFFAMIYLLFLFIIFLVPVVYLMINIVLTIIAIKTKRVFFARVLSIYGFLGLTIFNAIASINMLKEFNKKREEEKKA